MADQNERAFQKQPTINLNKKGGLKAGEARFMSNPGLGFKTPAEARTGNYIDKKCPFTGKCSIRGRILTGVVAKLKMNKTAVIRRDYLHYVKKYNRYVLNRGSPVLNPARLPRPSSQLMLNGTVGVL